MVDISIGAVSCLERLIYTYYVMSWMLDSVYLLTVLLQ